jgi:hypothetical protein
MVNARGALLMDRLQDIPNRVREIASHEVRQGAAIALAMMQTQLGHELRSLQPIFLDRDGRVDFEDLVDEFDEATGSIDNIVDADSIVNKVFLHQ